MCKAKVIAFDFDAYKAQFMFDVQCIVELEEIPVDLVTNWDHTGIHYEPVSNWMLAEESSKRVEIAGVDDKQQIMAVFAGNRSGNFLPPQIIYAGKSKRSIPSVNFLENWHVTHTENHWANEKITEDYIQLIILPYVTQKRKYLSLADNHPTLVIFDRFKGQCTERILSLLVDNL